MDEASKTNKLRGEEFIKKYFRGKVIDIGCGDDLVVPNAEPFDKIHGNAESILDYRPAGGYDCVQSSHALEHMSDVPKALHQWWGLVKPGGYLVIVVPDEDLYEQGIWPSLFNEDHKSTFRIGKETSWSPVSYDLKKLSSALPGSTILSLEKQDQGYDYSLKRHGSNAWGIFVFRMTRWFLIRLDNRRKNFLKKVGIDSFRLKNLIIRVSVKIGAPVDQTLDGAVAQIQIVLEKTG